MTDLAIAISIYLLIPIAIFGAFFWVGAISLAFFTNLFGGKG
jgi:hypothetical protein